MEERIIWILLLFILSLWGCTSSYKILTTPIDELYSQYRNTIDKSPEDFQHRLFVKKTIVLGFTAATVIALVFFIFA